MYFFALWERNIVLLLNAEQILLHEFHTLDAEASMSTLTLTKISIENHHYIQIQSHLIKTALIVSPYKTVHSILNLCYRSQFKYWIRKYASFG